MRERTRRSIGQLYRAPGGHPLLASAWIFPREPQPDTSSLYEVERACLHALGDGWQSA